VYNLADGEKAREKRPPFLIFFFYRNLKTAKLSDEAQSESSL
jgi:hypothetical protein